jgi:hypothetical protein
LDKGWWSYVFLLNMPCTDYIKIVRIWSWKDDEVMFFLFNIRTCRCFSHWLKPPHNCDWPIGNWGLVEIARFRVLTPITDGPITVLRWFQPIKGKKNTCRPQKHKKYHRIHTMSIVVCMMNDNGYSHVLRVSNAPPHSTL